ncbi:MAG: hypothetical protein QOJ19_1196 [Acidimicrobiia bacterium]|nr:hypothetical protein [Acidimicrobiia bacterium]
MRVLSISVPIVDATALGCEGDEPERELRLPRRGVERLSPCRHTEEYRPISGRRINLADLGLGAGQADAESFYLALPALLPCLSNAVNEMAADVDQRATSDGIGAKEKATDTGKRAPAKKAARKPRNSSSSSVDVQVGSAVRARIHAFCERPQRGIRRHAGHHGYIELTRSPGRLHHRARRPRRRPGRTDWRQAARPHGVPVAGRRRRNRPHPGRPPPRTGPDTAPARHRKEHELIPATTADTSRRHLREASA